MIHRETDELAFSITIGIHENIQPLDSIILHPDILNTSSSSNIAIERAIRDFVNYKVNLASILGLFENVVVILDRNHIERFVNEFEKNQFNLKLKDWEKIINVIIFSIIRYVDVDN